MTKGLCPILRSKGSPRCSLFFLKQHILAMSDIHPWELHEAYAMTTLYNPAQMKTPWDITNVSGGAVHSGIRYLQLSWNWVDAPPIKPSLEYARRAAWRRPSISSVRDEASHDRNDDR
jgi:hypothetical protein